MKINHIHLLYLINKTLCSPLEAMFSILVFIVSKEVGITPLQIAVFTAAKPIVSIFSLYMSSFIVGKAHRIGIYLFTVNLLGCLLCMFFPFSENPWYYIASFALFTTTSRAAAPAWSELLKNYVGLREMAKSISQGTSINYAAILFLPLVVSYWMDQYTMVWKMFFISFALLQIINAIVLLFKIKLTVPIVSMQLQSQPIYLIAPWKQAWQTLRESSPFAKYLLMFFLGGTGLVAMQSVLPIYFKENLHLSYTQLTLAFSCCKGISFLATSPIWANYTNRTSLFFINCMINIFSCFFIIFILTSKLYLGWLYVAYLMYGTMQSGCEISWNISGPVFSKEKESTAYSNLNLILVGLRGFVSPAIGQLIFIYSGAVSVFITALILCFASLIYAYWLNRLYAKNFLCKALCASNDSQEKIVNL